jgi:GNAT superfamily N-acetyltransferase
MSFTISPFDTSFLNQLEKLPPKEWQTDAYELFLRNEWQPWFFPYQAVSDNQLIGFGMVFHFEEFAWLGWILAHPEFRRKGVGTAITQQLLDKATALGAKGFLLTATEMGKPIYEKLGFKATSFYRFFKCPEFYIPHYDHAKIRHATSGDLEKILQLDFSATGEKRKKLIESQLHDCIVTGLTDLNGFYMPNLGAGFMVASDKKSGIEMLNYRLTNDKRTVVVPDENTEAITYLLKNGFTEGFKIPRMVLGIEPKWNPEMIFCRGAGYCG